MDDGYRIVNGLKLPPKKVVKIVRTTANGPKGTVPPEPKVWFFRSEEGEVVGPCAVNGCRGLITRETPIRKEGWPAWKKAYEVPEFAEILVHAKPPASEKWFWALVFSPMVMWILAMVLGENTEPLLCFLVALVSTLLFLHLDGCELKKSGRDDDSGSLLLTLIVGLIYIPIYLFSRGTRYTKKYIPPIIWCVMLVFPMVLAVLGSVFDIEGLINQIDDEIQVNGREEMTGSDLIKEMEWMHSPGRTSAQKQARCDQIEGRKVAFDFEKAYVDDVEDVRVWIPYEGPRQRAIVRIHLPDKELEMEVGVSDENEAMKALRLSKGTEVKHVTGRIFLIDRNDYSRVELRDSVIVVK